MKISLRFPSLPRSVRALPLQWQPAVSPARHAGRITETQEIVPFWIACRRGSLTRQGCNLPGRHLPLQWQKGQHHDQDSQNQWARVLVGSKSRNAQPAPGIPVPTDSPAPQTPQGDPPPRPPQTRRSGHYARRFGAIPNTSSRKDHGPNGARRAHLGIDTRLDVVPSKPSKQQPEPKAPRANQPRRFCFPPPRPAAPPPRPVRPRRALWRIFARFSDDFRK